MDKFARMALLYDFYNPLLTSKQRENLDLYYQQDLSLGEIAEENGISRQAVHDLLKRTEKILLDYEDKLGLVEKYLDRRDKLQELKKMLADIPSHESPFSERIGRIVNELLAKDQL